MNKMRVNTVFRGYIDVFVVADYETIKSKLIRSDSLSNQYGIEVYLFNNKLFVAENYALYGGVLYESVEDFEFCRNVLDVYSLNENKYTYSMSFTNEHIKNINREFFDLLDVKYKENNMEVGILDGLGWLAVEYRGTEIFEIIYAPMKKVLESIYEIDW